MSLCHQLAGDNLVGFHLGLCGRDADSSTATVAAAASVAVATGSALVAARLQHAHSLQLHTQHIGDFEVVEALVLHRVAVGILEDEHSGGLVEDVLRCHDILLGQRQQGLLGGFGQLLLQGNARHGGTNLALHAVAFQLTLIVGLLLGQRLLQLAVDLLGRGKFATQFVKFFLDFFVACTAGDFLLQAFNLGGEAFVGGLVTGTLVGGTLQGADDAGHILAGLLALVPTDSTFRCNHGVHLSQGLAKATVESSLFVALRQPHKGGLLLVGQARQAFLCIQQI